MLTHFYVGRTFYLELLPLFSFAAAGLDIFAFTIRRASIFIVAIIVEVSNLRFVRRIQTRIGQAFRSHARRRLSSSAF